MRSAGGFEGFSFPSLTPAVRVLLFVNLGVFLAEVVVYFVSPAAFGALLGILGLVPARLFDLPPFLWQPATYGFLHDPSNLGHVFWNGLGLYFFGTLLEARQGTRWFARLYAAGLLGGAVGGVAWGLYQNPHAPAIGASAGVMAILVVAGLLYPRLPVYLFLLIPIPLGVLVVVFLAFDIFPLLREIRFGETTGTLHAGHLGGALAGFVYLRRPGWFEGPVRAAGSLARRVGASLERREASRERDRRRRLDALLDKVHREGLGSLSNGERRFLARASRRARRSGAT